MLSLTLNWSSFFPNFCLFSDLMSSFHLKRQTLIPSKQSATIFLWFPVHQIWKGVKVKWATANWKGNLLHHTSTALVLCSISSSELWDNSFWIFQPFEDTKNAFPFSHTSICNTLTHTETYTYTHKDSQSSHRNRGGDKSWVFVSVFVVMFSTGVLQKCSSPPPWHYNILPPPLCNSTNIAISPNRDTLSGGLCCHL